MPAKNPRLTVTLPPESHAVIAKLSELNDQSMASIVAELVIAVTPQLERASQMIAIAKRAKSDVHANLVESAERAEENLRPLVRFVENQFDLFGAGSQATSEKDPPSLTGGSGHPRTFPSSGSAGA